MEDDAASNCPAVLIDDDDAGGCWKTVIKKRRAHKMNTHKETQPSESISGVSQRNFVALQCKEEIVVHLASSD
ncbi:hypothetical protein MRX96_026727 [Rhipicephalus microplus]